MANRWRKKGNSDRLFSWAPKSLQTVNAAMKLKMLAPWKKSYDKPRQYIKKKRHNFDYKAMVFPVVISSESSLTCGCESWTIRKAEH